MFVSEIKDKIKKTWLDFYESNQIFVDRMVKTNSQWHYAFERRNAEGEKKKYFRPNSSFILGVICACDPQIAELIEFLTEANNCNLDYIISALDLNEDPKILLEKKQEQEEKENSQQAQLLPSVTPSDDVTEEYQ